MRHTKLVLFDIDGTLLKGSLAHVNAFLKAVREVYGVKANINFRLDGITDLQIITKLLEHEGLKSKEVRSKISECIRSVIKHYIYDSRSEKPFLLPGVEGVLESLKSHGVLMGVVTGNIEEIAWHKLEKAGIRDYFLVGGFGDRTLSREGLINMAMEKARELMLIDRKTEVFVIGDTPLDVKAGKKLHIKTIGVATGSFSKEQLRNAGADLVLEALKDKRGIIGFVLGYSP